MDGLVTTIGLMLYLTSFMFRSVKFLLHTWFLKHSVTTLVLPRDIDYVERPRSNVP